LQINALKTDKRKGIIMSKQTFFICDKCKVKIPLGQHETHTIPESCSEVYARSYDRDKKFSYPTVHAELCKDCCIGLLKVVREYLANKRT